MPRSVAVKQKSVGYFIDWLLEKVQNLFISSYLINLLIYYAVNTGLTMMMMMII